MFKSFAEMFRQATCSEEEPEGRTPYPYQERFATGVVLPHLLRAPTGAGKTATAVLGWLYRHLAKVPNTPRRLVYCLPMRVLVEQSTREAKSWIANLKLDVPVHVLMGGVDTDEWYLHPEKPAVLIGTQDMLLSRALNRGYAESRFHWPIDFGLLNNDCLWVFDEPQLMASGVSTSAQMHGLRKSLGTFGACPSVWMSATLEPGWLDTVDFAGKFPGEPLELSDRDYDPKLPLNKRMTATKTLAKLDATSSKDMKDVAKAVLELHKVGEGSQTLVILNTVERAKATFAQLKKQTRNKANFLLVHSRYRPAEREKLNAALQDKGEAAKGRIIVSTQVVEAGVDISARTLIAELAPWASIVQRVGRCNRTGDDGPGAVYWIDLDEEKQGKPYEAQSLQASRKLLNDLDGKDVSPKALETYRLSAEFPHKHVLRRRDLTDLFDTTPDLSGNDIDISRFVRGDEPDTDVQVFWRATAPRNEWDAAERRRQVARRPELCNVPIGSFKTDFLDGGKTAFRFDHLEGEWQPIAKKDSGSVVPGQTFWVTADQGGYDRELGWTPGAGRLDADLLVPLPAQPPRSRAQRPEGFYSSDEWAQQNEWRTIAAHTDEVVAALNAILVGLPVELVEEAERAALQAAARWHDWGKAHPIFQSGVRSEIDDPLERQANPNTPPEQRKKVLRPDRWQACRDVAKAPQEYWQKYRRRLSDQRSVIAKRFRHELASVLGLLSLQNNNRLPTEFATLSEDGRWLALYLVAAHHGKVRLSIRAMPGESPLPSVDQRAACGLWDGDNLPSADLGGGASPEAVELSLAPMELGGDQSWTARALGLRDRFKPFRLAYLEALLRAADCRASAENAEDCDA